MTPHRETQRERAALTHHLEGKSSAERVVLVEEHRAYFRGERRTYSTDEEEKGQ